MNRSQQFDLEGTLHYADWTVHYVVTEPSPGQWVAIGTVAFADGFRTMRVGRGRTTTEAVNNLDERTRGMCTPLHPDPVTHSRHHGIDMSGR